MKRKLYIGLNGYAGAGKDTVAKMISHILNYDFRDIESSWESFKQTFNPEDTATFPPNKLMNKCMCLAFADQLKQICANIFKIDIKNFYTKKSTAWICINKGYEFTEVKPDASYIVTAEDFYFNRDTYLMSKDKRYMSLREVLVYVGTYVLQDFLSKNVFTNICEIEISRKPSVEYVILSDVRFLHEFDYIKDHHGVMINITRDGIDQLDNITEHELDDEDDFDFVIENNRDYKSLFEQVWDMIHSNIIFANYTVTLDSHDNSDNYLFLEKKTESTYTWRLISEYGTSRVSHDNGEIIYIDPCGGPLISVGMNLDSISNIYHILNEHHTIDKIYFDEVTGYPIIQTVKQ